MIINISSSILLRYNQNEDDVDTVDDGCCCDEGDGAFSEEEKAEIELAIIFSPLSILSILFLCVRCVVVQSRLIW